MLVSNRLTLGDLQWWACYTQSHSRVWGSSLHPSEACDSGELGNSGLDVE